MKVKNIHLRTPQQQCTRNPRWTTSTLSNILLLRFLFSSKYQVCLDEQEDGYTWIQCSPHLEIFLDLSEDVIIAKPFFRKLGMEISRNLSPSVKNRKNGQNHFVITSEKSYFRLSFHEQPRKDNNYHMWLHYESAVLILRLLSSTCFPIQYIFFHKNLGRIYPKFQTNRCITDREVGVDNVNDEVISSKRENIYETFRVVNTPWYDLLRPLGFSLLIGLENDYDFIAFCIYLKAVSI